MTYFRHLVAILAAALIAGACAQSEIPAAAPPGAQAMVLSYGYAPGQELAYGVTMNVDMAADVDSGFGTESVAGSMSMDAGFRYLVGEGPTADTTEITVKVDLNDFSVSGFGVDGLDDVSMEDLGMSVDDYLPEVSVVLDRSGNTVSVTAGGAALPTDLFGGDLTGLAGAGTTSQMFGPAFPDQELFVGAKWSDSQTSTIPFFGEWTIESDYEVTRQEQRDGHNTWVIQSKTKMPALSMDMQDMIDAMFDLDDEALAGLGMNANDIGLMKAEFRMMERDGFGMDFTMKPQDVTGVTWFDIDTGVMVANSTAMDIEMTAKFSGDGMDGAMDMTMGMTMSMVLDEAEPA